MGDFAWRPLVKQARPVGGTMPPCTIAVSIRERGQPSVEVRAMRDAVRLTLGSGCP